MEPGEILTRFGDRTGLTTDARPVRYLWTDAFAVCTAVGLHGRAVDEGWLEWAALLVDQVHHVLGRHRPGDDRDGWISGLGPEEGALHPTAAGLRIGKPLPERAQGEPQDPMGEWDRDGQYYHYLTRWMHALLRIGGATGDRRYVAWAAELAIAAHEGSVDRTAREGPRLRWKMSVDLSRPLVPSTGHHDPLDGLITVLRVREALRALPDHDASADLSARLDAVAAELTPMCQGRSWATVDPLGAGGLLIDALSLARLPSAPEGLLETVVRDSARSAVGSTRDLAAPAHRRLAFRELGLAMGLEAGARLRQALTGPERPLGHLGRPIHTIEEIAPAADDIREFWLDPSHQEGGSWADHRDISEVMLAAALAPEGYLGRD